MLTKKEIVRKIIHLSFFFMIFLDQFISHSLSIYLLFIFIIIYTICESLRLKKIKVPIITDVINYCAYPQEKKSFIYAPLFFILSIFILLIFFDKTPAYVGIIALTLGDGLAGIVGKAVGKMRIPYNKNKTLEGSLTLFVMVIIESLFFVNLNTAFLVGILVTFVESLSEKIDNLTVPLTGAGIVALLI